MKVSYMACASVFKRLATPYLICMLWTCENLTSTLMNFTKIRLRKRQKQKNVKCVDIILGVFWSRAKIYNHHKCFFHMNSTQAGTSWLSVAFF